MIYVYKVQFSRRVVQSVGPPKYDMQVGDLWMTVTRDIHDDLSRLQPVFELVVREFCPRGGVALQQWGGGAVIRDLAHGHPRFVLLGEDEQKTMWISAPLDESGAERRMFNRGEQTHGAEIADA